VLQGNFGEEALEPAAPVGGASAHPLIVVDDQDAIPGPSQGGRMVGQGVLPFPRFAMDEDLVGIRLAHVDDGQAIEVPVEDLGRSDGAGLADRRVGSRPGGSGSVGVWGCLK
jgi:hypothetical protein